MNEPQLQIYEFDEFRVDVSKRLLTKGDGQQVPLTPKVFDTLLYLIQHSGRVIEKEELMREIWTDSVVEENNLNQNISLLRRVFGEKPGEQRFIVTVAGHGYRFVPEVKKISDLGPGIAPRETGEVVPKNNQEKRKVQGANSRGQKREEKERIGNVKPRIQIRKWLAAAVLTVSAFGAAGFYMWGGYEKSFNAPIKSIAVLPFKPLVVENRNEALEFGMAEALISKLSGEEVIVRPLSAIRRYQSLEQDTLTAGRELGVESILDGTIQTWGDRIRVSAKLLRTSDGKQLWAGQFDEKFTDIFVVQDSISEKVALALKIRLGKEKKHSTENVEAYQAYMTGRYHLDKLTPPDIRKSIPYFQHAIDLDPGYALAYTRLAQVFGVLAIGGEMPAAEAFPKANAAAQKAIEIDDTLGEAHDALCMGLFWNVWDWKAAEKECLRSIEINPNNAESHGNYAGVLSNTGPPRGSPRRVETFARTKPASSGTECDGGSNFAERRTH